MVEARRTTTHKGISHMKLLPLVALILCATAARAQTQYYEFSGVVQSQVVVPGSYPPIDFPDLTGTPYTGTISYDPSVLHCSPIPTSVAVVCISGGTGSPAWAVSFGSFELVATSAQVIVSPGGVEFYEG